MRKYARITGTGSYLPARVMPNSEWEQYVETSDAWIRERAGISERRIAGATETTSSMGLIAAQRALAAAQCSAQDIDLIIVATCTPDNYFPATACLIQQNLPIDKTIIAFDVSAACSGFIYALSIADQFIQTGMVKQALVIGSEVMSRSVDWSDRTTCVLFGDGAGAVVLSAGTEPGILSTHLHAQGKYQDILTYPNPQAHHPTGAPKAALQMQGREVFKRAVNHLGEVAEETVRDNLLHKTSIDWLIPHQANLRIITATAKKLDLPLERVIITVDKHGNTSSASVPLALDTGVRDGRIQPGETVLLEAFGGGMTWGAALVRM